MNYNWKPTCLCTVFLFNSCTKKVEEARKSESIGKAKCLIRAEELFANKQ